MTRLFPSGPSPLSCAESGQPWTLNSADIECLSVGAGILGCGGGGNPHLGKLRLLNLIDQGKVPTVVPVEWMLMNYHHTYPVLFVGFMGAPVVLYERSASGVETSIAARYLAHLMKHPECQDQLNCKNVPGVEDVSYADKVEQLISLSTVAGLQQSSAAVCSFEIGGMNSLEPLAVSAETGVFCADADGMGRAFPELQMFTPFFYDVLSCPAVLVSDEGRVTVAFSAESYKALEDAFRKICIENGGSSGLSLAAVTLKETKDTCVLGSISRAWKLGKHVLEARKAKVSVLKAILSTENGRFLCRAKVMDVSRRMEGGFNKGRMVLQGLEDFSSQKFLIEFQNENLIVRDLNKNQVLASVPNLICVLDADSGLPIATEELRYGLRVLVLLLAPDRLLTTERALKVIGPKAFGYSDVDYEPLSVIENI